MTALTERDIPAVVRGVAGAFETMAAAAIAKAVAPLEARIAELETQQKAMGYRGTWQARTRYARGSFVTCGGSMWAALEDTDSKPGADGTWQLAVKRGRDGRRDREPDA